MWEMPNPHRGLDLKALGSLCRPTIIIIIIIATTIARRM
jgi:hypothetical protein